jgi:sulfur carrier protein
MIYINDKAYDFEGAPSLTELFNTHQLNVSKGVAVALNNTVIPRTEWNNVTVKANDKLILIKATQGG